MSASSPRYTSFASFDGVVGARRVWISGIENALRGLEMDNHALECDHIHVFGRLEMGSDCSIIRGFTRSEFYLNVVVFSQIDERGVDDAQVVIDVDGRH